MDESRRRVIHSRHGKMARWQDGKMFGWEDGMMVHHLVQRSQGGGGDGDGDGEERERS